MSVAESSKNPNLTIQNIAQWTGISAIASAIVNAIVFLVAGGVFENILAQNQTITVVSVVIITVLLVVIGGVILYAMSRFLDNALTYWIYIGIGFTVLYGVAPFTGLTSTVEDGSVFGAAIVLNILHAVAAGITLYLMGTQLKAE